MSLCWLGWALKRLQAVASSEARVVEVLTEGHRKTGSWTDRGVTEVSLAHQTLP